jgi:PAS domain S-box-containing protein
MFSLDMRTAIFSYVLITIISTFVITLLLRQYSSRYKGVPYMLLCFALQTMTLILILLRGKIPDWISFDLANTISVAGIIFFYIGIEAYVGKKSSIIPNLILLIVFAAVHTWFTFWKPNLAARHLNISVVWLIIFVQCTWLLLYRVPRSKFKLTFSVSLVCLAFCLVCLVRIIKFFLIGHKSEDYFNSDWFDTAMVLICQVLLILLTYSLEHMFGSHLLQDIKSEEEKFSKAFNTSPYGIIITRFPDGQIIEINKGFQNITGYTSLEVLGKTTLEGHFWLSEDDRNSILAELFRSGKVYGKELNFLKKSGESITCLLSSEVISINDEDCLLSSVEDITDRKKYELELIKSKEKAEENDRLKTAFMHNISHEIRTPMNAIVGFSALLCEPDLDQASKQSFMDLITKSSDHLLSIVSDIMEISNIEAGILKLNIRDININDLLNNLYKQFTCLAVEKGTEFKITCELNDSDSNIQADGTKLLQILTNLLSNAFKFTDKGQIEFGYKLKNDYLEFHVSDTGIGIPMDSHEKIFDRFYQVDYSSSRPYEGTGLGLSISKAYIELSGGKIRVESNPGEGTTFYFTIPYIKPGQPPKIEKEIIKPERKINIERKTVLIAEDVESNFQLLVGFLSLSNVNLIHARNGKEAIEICKSGKKIDLVLMDIKMPIMDGFEATGVITGMLPNVPVIAQTAYAFESDKKNILTRGFIDYISKPYKKDDLVELVEKYLD